MGSGSAKKAILLVLRYLLENSTTPTPPSPPSISAKYEETPWADTIFCCVCIIDACCLWNEDAIIRLLLQHRDFKRAIVEGIHSFWSKPGNFPFTPDVFPVSENLTTISKSPYPYIPDATNIHLHFLLIIAFAQNVDIPDAMVHVIRTQIDNNIKTYTEWCELMYNEESIIWQFLSKVSKEQILKLRCMIGETRMKKILFKDFVLSYFDERLGSKYTFREHTCATYWGHPTIPLVVALFINKSNQFIDTLKLLEEMKITLTTDDKRRILRGYIYVMAFVYKDIFTSKNTKCIQVLRYLMATQEELEQEFTGIVKKIWPLVLKRFAKPIAIFHLDLWEASQCDLLKKGTDEYPILSGDDSPVLIPGNMPLPTEDWLTLMKILNSVSELEHTT